MHPAEMSCAAQEQSSPSFFSCSSSSNWEYDVFMSFAGKDTRLNFTDHLYEAFGRSGINCFKDDKGIKGGDVIKEKLLQAIKESLCAVIVLSENYANSTWCLDELEKILESQKKFGGYVFPVFYGVDPCDVRYQRKNFGKALHKHEKRFIKSLDKVQKWRDALEQVSNFSGWDSENRNETEVIREIVVAVWNTVCSNLPSYDDNLVGIRSRMVKVNSLLETEADDIRFVGIWGMGGIGKTTLARLVFERISDQFEMSCFLANVREISKRKGLVRLQNDILLHLNKGQKICDEHYGKKILNRLFQNKKVLLVLDDVNHMNQLENLACPKWFGAGSRVIITTRNLHLLKSQDVHRIFEVKPMGKDESLELFSKKALKKDHPEDDYLVLSEAMVKYAGGIPLALYVLGSLLCGRSLLEWEETLERMKKIPDKDIFQILEISYLGLNDEEKTIFLDIACFFNGWRRDEVAQILKSCDLCPTIGINILIERALLIEKKALNGETILEVHDLLQELARSIVFQESPGHARCRSRLWNLEDIDGVLKNDKVIWWWSYPLETLPFGTELDKLVHIQMPFSKIKHWNCLQTMKNLKFIDLSNSIHMIGTPDFSETPNLEKLNLEGCSSLRVVHHSLGELKKLVGLNLSSCKSLEILPRKMETNSLSKLDISWCEKLSILPEFGECMKNLTVIDAMKTAITKLPESLGLLSGLENLNLRGPRKHVLQMSGFNPTPLTMLDISYCGISS